jgi:hypothetical protein
MARVRTSARRERREQFCLEQLAENAVTLLGAVLNQPETVQVGGRTPKQSRAILKQLASLPCKNVYLLNPAQLEAASSATVVKVDQFVLEMPKAAAARRAVRNAVASWLQLDRQELQDDVNEGWLYFDVK